MNNFEFKNNYLFFDNINISDIVKKLDTPFYLTSEDIFRHRINIFKNKLKKNIPNNKNLIAYAVKANDRHRLLKIVADEGLGADVVSKGEVIKALSAGIKGENIVFSGIAKDEEQIIFALENNISNINIESVAEFNLCTHLAIKLGRTIYLNLRFNPDINVKTHKNIRTGSKYDKFGISFRDIISLVKANIANKHVIINGLSIHIGSNIKDISSFNDAFKRLAKLRAEIAKLGLQINKIDFGGGVGCEKLSLCKKKDEYEIYDESNFDFGLFLDNYFSLINKHFPQFNGQFIFEPGRCLVANSTILICKIIRIKDIFKHKLIIINSGMNNFQRKVLYNSIHGIVPLKINDTKSHKYRIVGPVCESSDDFGFYTLPNLGVDDYICFLQAGAYGGVMGNYYNSLNTADEYIFSQKGVFQLCKKLDVQAQIKLEQNDFFIPIDEI